MLSRHIDYILVMEAGDGKWAHWRQRPCKGQASRLDIPVLSLIGGRYSARDTANNAHTCSSQTRRHDRHFDQASLIERNTSQVLLVHRARESISVRRLSACLAVSLLAYRLSMVTSRQRQAQQSDIRDVRP
jgi:hypothetical protein